MKLQITVDVFSGRPNPVMSFTGKQAEDAVKRLQPVRKLPKEKKGMPFPTLGYRGLVVEFVEGRGKNLPKMFRVADGVLMGKGLLHTAADEDFEDFVCGTVPRPRFGPKRIDFNDILLRELFRFRRLIYRYIPPRVIFWPPFINPCRCAPLYEPAWWNDGGQRQHNNNCYNYATNYRTDTFAQPGEAAGAMYTALTCASVKPAAVADALIDNPTANNRCPSEGHLVALVIAPGWDFHWYRKGRNGSWSHKPGGTQVTNLDNSGNPIPDPRTADRGPYTDFCTFMTVMHGHIKIR